MNDSSAPCLDCSPGLSWIDAAAKATLVRSLEGLQDGRIVLRDAADSLTFGSGGLEAEVVVRDPAFYRRLTLGGTLAAAESYFRGEWECDDLARLFRVVVRNMQSARRLNGGVTWLARQLQRMYHWTRRNTIAGSRDNIGAHYDLGNDFFALWLDDTLAYSSGIFAEPDYTLREASIEKFDRICRRLDLRPDERVLEIGSGWGGFALHAASEYGCHVTTTTISRRQFETTQRRVTEAGLSDRVKVLLKDYRELKGQYDKLVSIEMIEAVGAEYFDAYFERCSALLAPHGSFALQAIVMPESRYPAYLKSVDFIQRYVFPGGCLPSIGAIMDSVGRNTDLRLVQCEDFAGDYAETLRRWRGAFESRIDEVRRLGHSEEFIRLWRYYLCYCEAAFEERYIGLVQMHFDKPKRHTTVRSRQSAHFVLGGRT